jgi:glucokinase
MATASGNSSPTRRLYLGIDVGGTGIKLGVVDDSGVALGHAQIDTQHERGAADGVSRILVAAKSVVAELNLSWDDIDALGIGTPGTMDIRAGKLLHMPNMRGWDEFPIRSYLEEQTGKPVAFMNDGTAAAYGEFWAGRGRECSSIVMLTLGTGVGGGIIISGSSLDGEHSHGSECGHIIIDGSPTARRCPCGQLGHLEAYVSATSVAQRTLEGLRDGVDSSLAEFLENESALSAFSVFEHAQAEDAFAIRVIEETAVYLSIGITSIMHILDPDMVILGGAMNFGAHETEAGRMFIKTIRDKIAEATFPVLAEQTMIDFASLGNHCGFIGAAGIARAQFGATPDLPPTPLVE